MKAAAWVLGSPTATSHRSVTLPPTEPCEASTFERSGGLVGNALAQDCTRDEHSDDDEVDVVSSAW